MSEIHVSDLIPAYALDCLDPMEKQSVDRHLATCKVCQEELRAYLDLAGQLALAIPEHNPPASLKSAIMNKVQAPATRLQPEPARQSRWRAWLQPFSQPAWGAISLVLILVMAISNLLLWQQVNKQPAQQASAFFSVPMTAAASDPNANGVIVMSKEGDFGTLVVNNLPALPPSQEYQLWLNRDNYKVSGGLFTVKQDGYAAMVIHSNESLLNYKTFGITVEPMGGSPAPTGQKVLGGKLD
jgi:anti-sigma-K factor RskA